MRSYDQITHSSVYENRIHEIASRVAQKGIHGIRKSSPHCYQIVNIPVDHVVLDGLPTLHLAEAAATYMNRHHILSPQYLQEKINEFNMKLSLLNQDLENYQRLSGRSTHFYDRVSETYHRINQIHNDILRMFFI